MTGVRKLGTACLLMAGCTVYLPAADEPEPTYHGSPSYSSATPPPGSSEGDYYASDRRGDPNAVYTPSSGYVYSDPGYGYYTPGTTYSDPGYGDPGYSTPSTPAPSAPVDDDKVHDDCTFNGIKLWGDVKIVDSFPDIEVKVVTSFPDLNVKVVDSFPDSCGRWKFVDSFPDFTIKIVESFPDVQIKYVDSFPGLP